MYFNSNNGPNLPLPKVSKLMNMQQLYKVAKKTQFALSLNVKGCQEILARYRNLPPVLFKP